MCKIRRAVGGDTPGILRTWEESVRATHDFLNEEEITFYKERIPRYLTAVELSVFEDEGEIKGFSGIADGMLEMLFVSERGRGIGSQLLADAIGKGITRVDVNEQNWQAAGFYAAKGFAIGGRSETDGEGRPHPILHLALER